MKQVFQKFAHHSPMIILVVYLCVNLVSFWFSQNRELVNHFEDDAYYYFKIAANIVDLNMITFDTLTLTSGFHPLWMLVLLPLTAAINNPFLFLRTVGIISTLLIGTGAIFAFRYLQKRYSPLATLFASAMMLSCLIDFGSTGMETSLLIPLLTISILILAKLSPWSRSDKTPGQEKYWIWLGISLSLAQLARLDAFLFNLTILVYIFFSDRSAQKWMRLIKTGLPIFITGCAYLLFNFFTYQHLFPTSGLSKSIQGGWINKAFMAQLFNFKNPEGTAWNLYLALIFVAIGFVVYYLTNTLRKRKNQQKGESNTLPLIVSAFFLLYTLYQLFGTSWVLWRWHLYPIYLMSMTVIPFMVEKFLARLQQNTKSLIPTKKIIAVCIISIFMLMTVIGITAGNWQKTQKILFPYENYLIAKELNTTLQQPVIFAMGDRAGSFAYFFNGDVLQIEGLVSDYSVIQAIEENTLEQYMTDFGVQYVVSQAAPPSNYSEWTLLTPLPKHSSGPKAEIRLCKRSEFLRRETQFEPIFIWKWPSCLSE
ncbi:MAG: hypothetical protein CVU43_10145 [Chloroflexi bacterium HGW-Chloroflexi-5]|nr:MAG: hypothetical protein CVU43_10145 [Chloroflexi bacterium HGW-Chloroflexi-5]